MSEFGVGISILGVGPAVGIDTDNGYTVSGHAQYTAPQ